MQLCKYSSYVISSHLTSKSPSVYYTGLMIMASHQIFPAKLSVCPAKSNFGQTNFLYIINGHFMEFAKENECPDNF